ncbi:MAG: hypothetical protein EXR64_02950 [Dehalococcoidia bacterium]|nr:hypothetical protein [Dehalococcoidia bacterium]
MIEIVRFDHVSMAVPELAPQVDLLERLFGFRAGERFRSEDGYLGIHLAMPGSSDIGWEVLAPSSPTSPLHRFLEGPTGPGLHHLAIRVRDIGQAAEALRVEGAQPWSGGEEGADAEPEVIYIHPRGGGHGFLYQLYEGEPGNAEPVERAADDADGHTLGIKALNHLSHAYSGCDELGDWYERLFGMETIHRSEGDGADTGFRTRVLEHATRQIRFEIIEPASAASFIQRFLERRGPGMHHATFEVADWERAVSACAYHNVPIFGERAGTTYGVPWREAFIHPRHTGGMLVQFFWQAEDGAWI